MTEKLQENRQYYLYVIDGTVQVNGEKLSSGDAAIFTQLAAGEKLEIQGEAAEVILFDVAKKE